MSALTQSAAWQALQGHAKTLARVQMREMFAQEPGRFGRFSLRLGDLLLDYSKNRITTKTLALLLDLARAAELEGWIERMFRGDRINTTEDRAVLHVALRNRSNRPIQVEGVDVMPAVNAVLARMREFALGVRGGSWTGFDGRRIGDVVGIGIGGSNLGPEMAVAALRPYATPHCRVRFVSNVDGAQIATTLAGLDPATTLFVVVSKSFTTSETLANARAARAWFLGKGGAADALDKHFVAVSASAQAVADFRLNPARRFEMWDWVGGRFSMWSAAGLPIALGIGFDRFAEMLDGAHAMDEHFRTAPLNANMPVLLGLLGVWYTNFLGAGSHVVVPYDRSLGRFPAFLQQVEMESNGKHVTRDGAAVDYATVPVVWGAPGTDSQHAFFQALHQGTAVVPVDFLAPLESHYTVDGQHAMLLANCLAQSEALMNGKTAAEARAELTAAGLDGAAVERQAPHRVCPGNRPSNTLLFRRLDPRTLGALIALYEHKVFVQGTIWRINAFDQWGVELGKKLAGRILAELGAQEPAAGHDASTNGLIDYCRQARRPGG
ncbi:MAG: glucose-6-phosphate isomerase [Dongiaceae bacterium]